MKTRVIYDRLIPILILILICSRFAAADSKGKTARSSDMMMGARAKMKSIAPYPKFEIAKLINEIKNKQKKTELNRKELELLFLMQFAQEIGHVKTVSMRGPQTLPTSQLINQLNSHMIISSFENEITQHSKNKKKLSQSDSVKIKQNLSRLEAIFGAESFSWAWILCQINEQESAKKILSNLFNMEYDRTMQKKMAHFGMGRNPLAESEKIYKALYPLSDSKKQIILDKKMRKIKVHLSNLPQSNIRT
jgi:hypothetical protein